MSSSILFVFVVLLMHTCMVPCEAADVTATACTNRGTECSAIANAVCDYAATPMCKCALYAPMTGASCIATPCDAAGTCTALDANSECSGTTAGTDTCRCKTGYSIAYEGPCQKDLTSTVCTATDTDCNFFSQLARCDPTALKCKCGSISAMLANACFGKACTAAATCTALDANSECDGTTARSECQCKTDYQMGTDGKCALTCDAVANCTALDANSECSGTTGGSVCRCKTGYLMGTDGKCALTCNAAATCTALDANSECSGTTAGSVCRCKTGYLIGTDGKCPKSGAATVLVSMTMLFACFMARLL